MADFESVGCGFKSHQAQIHIAIIGYQVMGRGYFSGLLTGMATEYALLAQLVEQATLNRQVIGSIPMQRIFIVHNCPRMGHSADVAELADAYDLGSYA